MAWKVEAIRSSAQRKLGSLWIFEAGRREARAMDPNLTSFAGESWWEDGDRNVFASASPDSVRGSVAYQPMYCPPLADRLAPVIQLASSGMKKDTA